MARWVTEKAKMGKKSKRLTIRVEPYAGMMGVCLTINDTRNFDFDFGRRGARRTTNNSFII